MKYIDEDSKKSSMRLNLLLASVATMVILLAVAVYIIVMAVKGQLITDWSGMGVFCLGLLGGLSGVSFAKSNQKKHEMSNNKSG